MNKQNCTSSIKNIESGAINLLQNCAGVNKGDFIVIVGEIGPDPFFEPELCDVVAEVASKMDCTSEIVMVAPMASGDEFPTHLSMAMEKADVTIFFSRLGDQQRFSNLPGTGKKIMTYTLTRNHLGASFGRADYHIGQEIQQKLLKTLIKTKSYQIKAPCGTNLISDVGLSNNYLKETQKTTNFSVDLFPEMIFPPINCLNLQGKLVIGHFLLSTSTRIYENSALKINSDVIATVENSRMVAFEGAPKEIKTIKNQLKRAAAITGGDPYVINSWHTGINPHTFFKGDPYGNLEHWGTVAFGSPRYTHIHCAGNDPGDVCMQVFDATITCDNQKIWDKGQFAFLNKPEIKAIWQKDKENAAMYQISQSIGI
jgi:hypothetical protein